MNIFPEQLKRLNAPLTGFSREPVLVEGTIVLLVIAGSIHRWSQVYLSFTVVKTPSAYDAIFGRPRLNALHAIVSTYYLIIKFPNLHGVGEVHENQALGDNAIWWLTRPNLQTLSQSARDELTKKRGEPIEDLVAIPLHDGNPQHSSNWL